MASSRQPFGGTLHVAKLTSLAASFFLVSMAAMPARAASEETAAPLMVASRVPTPLQEPHAVDKPAPAAAPQQAMVAKASARHEPGVPKPKARPAPAEAATAVKPKPAPARPKVAAKAKSTATSARKLAHRPMRHPHALAQRDNHAAVQTTREARQDFQEHREYRPESGPLYPAPPAATVPGCDETCQYRDWLNRYAAWYRDFGRYYYGAPPRPAATARPMPPPAIYGENRPAPGAPVQAYGRAESERDRLDPWHGYNSHSPDNGY